MLINVQFLRFVAAMLVVIYHESAHLRATGHSQGWFFGFGEATGFAGVDVFFVISGFIMAWTTRDDAGITDAWRFARRRVARIYSGYWPFFALALLLFAVTDPARLERVRLLESAALWPISSSYMLITVAWTLVFEMLFYAGFTVLIAFAGRHRPGVFTFLFSAAIGVTLFNQFYRQAWAPENIVQMSIFAAYGLSPFLLEFLAGAVLADRLRRAASTPAHRLTGWLMLAVGAGIYISGMWVNNALFDGRIAQGYFVFWRVLVFGGAATLAIAGLVRLEQAGLRAPVKFSLLAGGASYAIYLSHTLVLEATRVAGLNDWLAGQSPGMALTAFVGLAILILLACIAWYQWLERPLHKSFRRILRA